MNETLRVSGRGRVVAESAGARRLVWQREEREQEEEEGG
jgi:hypothetical protein